MLIINGDHLSNMSLYGTSFTDRELNFISNNTNRGTNRQSMFRDRLIEYNQVRKRNLFINRIHNHIADEVLNAEDYFISKEDWLVPEPLKPYIMAHPTLARAYDNGRIYGFGLPNENVRKVYKYNHKYCRVRSNWITDTDDKDNDVFVYTDSIDDELDYKSSHNMIRTWENAIDLYNNDIDPTEN